MPTIEPVFGLSLSIEAVRTAIAACPAWHDWTRVSAKPEDERPAAAARRVHYFSLPAPERPESGYAPDELERLYPACGLTFIPPVGLRTNDSAYRLDRTACETFNDKAIIFIHIVDTVEAAIEHDYAAVMMKFCNRLGEFMWALPETHNVDGAAFFQTIELAVEPNRATKVVTATQGDFIQAILRVRIGLND